MADLASPLGVDVVILTWRDVDATVRAVRSVLTQPAVATVIVVDNESSGDLVEPLSKIGDSRVRLLQEPYNLGFAAGVNRGIAIAATQPARHLLVLNNDAWLGEGAVAALVAGLGDRVGMVGPRVVSPEGSLLSLGGRFSDRLMRVRSVSSGIPDFITWACVLVDKRVFSVVGGLDASYFMYWEDVEFALRVRRAGFVIESVPEAQVVHAISSSHAIAGSKIKTFSTMGLVVLGRMIGPRAAGGVVLTVGGRCVKAIARGDWQGLAAVVRGATLGALLPSGISAHEVLRSRGVI